MRSLKKIIPIIMAGIILLSSVHMVYAETSQETLNKSKSQLQQSEELIQDKEKEQKNVSNELLAVQNELTKTEAEWRRNKKNIEFIQQQIEDTRQKIETKKDEIVALEDKVLARKDIMKDRLISMQHTDQTNTVIDVLLNSENFADFISRATAISVFLNVDKDLLEQQEVDLKKIEEEKEAIDKQEGELVAQHEALASSQNDLEKNLTKRQSTLQKVQQKLDTISKQVSLAQNEKSAILTQISKAEADLKKEKEAVKKKPPVTNAIVSVSTNESTQKPVTSSNNEVIYMSSTAYSHEDTSSNYTSLGYNIKKNPNMKLIAVDPKVIPLGSKVWVEGYGEAIAGDTGGAIKGHKIDVLMPSTKKALQWGRRTVKVIILKQ